MIVAFQHPVLARVLAWVVRHALQTARLIILVSLDTLYLTSPPWLQTALLNAHAMRIERHRYGAPYDAATRQLVAQQYWSRDQLAAYQGERLRLVLENAFRHSPRYRSVMEQAGLQPADIRSIEDIHRLPILTKADLRAHGPDLLTARKPRRGWLHGHTSGTTGSPLSLWYDRNTCVMNNAVDRRQKLWGGMESGDWLGVLLGRVVVPTQQTKPPFWRANYVQRQLWLSSFHMSDANLDAYTAEIRRRGLRFLEGYPSTLFILAQHLTRQGEVLPMKAVFTSSETLHEIQRETIEAAFACRVFDFYGHAERVIFATECEYHDGKHLAEEYGYTEIVDNNNQPVADGEPGYLVGTTLHNLAFPMIRYRTGDISAIVREPCACGRTLARIRGVSTKAEDILMTPSGRMISPSILTHAFKPFDQIRTSQIIQDQLDHVLVKIVASSAFTEELQRVFRDAFQERVGPEISVDIVLVDEIARERSGKFRWVISNVDHACRLSWEPVGE